MRHRRRHEREALVLPWLCHAQWPFLRSSAQASATAEQREHLGMASAWPLVIVMFIEKERGLLVQL